MATPSLIFARSLAQIAGFVADYLTTHLGPREDFAPEQIAMIQAGLEAAEGRAVPHDEVMAEMDRMLELKTALSPTPDARPPRLD